MFKINLNFIITNYYYNLNIVKFVVKINILYLNQNILIYLIIHPINLK